MLATTAEIDEIRKEAGQREFRLYIDVDRGEWLLPRAVWLLQEKLNAYASFVLDGKMRELYPYAQAHDVRIVIRSRGQPPQDALRLVGLVRQALEKDGPKLELEQVA
ncbi:MAG TPA: DUF6572 domain-containing protein [Myxococcales bacterium]|jgi:hypothetical protein|nr:DUF6572 domain-containing protein [Myxococcales bacterium]